MRIKHMLTIFTVILSVSLFFGISHGEEVLKEFTFTDIDGKTFKSTEFAGKPLVIVTMATWCPPCKREAPDLEKAYRVYKDRDITFLGVFVASTQNSIRKFAEKYDLTFPVGTGEGIWEQFGWRPFPSAGFVSADGIIVKKHSGQISYPELVESIEEILE